MNMTSVAQRLESKFGLGTRPDLRRALFKRLEQLVDTEGERAYIVIASAAADSAGKDNPGHYFTRVVTLRLYERGVLKAQEF